MNVGKVRWEKMTKMEKCYMLTCIVWTFQEHCHPSALSYNLCNNSPQHYYITKFRFFSIDAFITLKYAPICGVIVMYTMYMYYNISSKSKFAMGSLCFIYLDSAIDRQLNIACVMRRNKKWTAPSSLQILQ